MAAVWLIVISVIVSLLLLAMSFYLLVYYSHPDDGSKAYFPKIVVVLSFTLSQIMILMLALDVANQAGNPLCNRVTSFVVVPRNSTQAATFSPTPTFSPTEFVSNDTVLPDVGVEVTFSPPCGDLAIGTLWMVMWFAVAIFVALIIPFNIFFYEANETGRKFQSKLCEAMQYQGVALVLSGLTLGIMYWQINQFSMPIVVIPNNQADTGPLTCQDPANPACIEVLIDGTPTILYNPNTTFLTVQNADLVTGDVKQLISLVPNSFGTYLSCFMSFIGWFLFSLYTGIGFIALPNDLIKGFLYRPKYIPKDIYIKLREDMRQRLNSLLELGEKMKKERKQYDVDYNKLGYFESRTKNNTQRTAFKQFKKEVMQLEIDYEDIRICHEAWSTYNPLIPYLKLAFGIISTLLTICWILQILLFILPQYWPTGASYIPTFFLNDLVTWGLINSGFALIGVLFLAIFGLYLLACNITGSFKIGLRFMIMDIHPMVMGGTYMSSFLVNMVLILLQTPALINFLAQSFSNTIVLTDIDLIMNYAVRYTIFFVYFFENNVFIFLLLSFTVLSMCLTYVLPDDRKKNAKRLKNKIDKMSSAIDEKDKAANKKVRGLDLKNIVKQATAKGEDGEDEEGDGRLAGT